MAAAKFVCKSLFDNYNSTTLQIIDAHNLWIADEWTHLGNVIVVCVENEKLVQVYKNGNTKVLDSLLGKTIQYSNMNVDLQLIKEIIPLVIDTYF